MRAKERVGAIGEHVKPLLMVDIDGVVSLFGGWEPGGGLLGARRPGDGRLHSIDGTPHFLSSIAAAHLLELSSLFELVWASGWEERANEHLPRLLGLPPELPFLRFPRAVGAANAHWKLAAIDSYAGERALAWVDDALNDACHEWAHARTAPTLLVTTDPQRGLTAGEAQRLASWARALCERPAGQ
jgi:HAD domain in Swiss Army Knife RNA repair proteins